MTDELSKAWTVIRDRMRQVARPDSRFDMDLDSFIPAFAGIDTASRTAADHPVFSDATTLFVTPDNSIQPLRHMALAAGKTLVMPTYGLKRGFLQLGPETVDPTLALYASWGDGAEHFGTFLPISDLPRARPFDLALVGAAAVTMTGRRFGMGHRYFDVEWNIFHAAGLVSDTTPIWTVVHDLQISDSLAAGAPDQVAVDRVFTPTRTLSCQQGVRPMELRPETLSLLFGETPPAQVAEAVRLVAAP